MNIFKPEITKNPWRSVREQWEMLEELNKHKPIEIKRGFDKPDFLAVPFHNAAGEMHCWRFKE